MTRLPSLVRLLVALLVLTGTAAAQQPELLPPGEAYRLSARIDGDTLHLRYAIEDGYYLYGDKFGAETSTPAVSLGALVVPPGKVKEDPWFGRVETHRENVELTVPLQMDGVRPTVLSVQARSQGCADIGVCFPPYTHSIDVEVPAVVADSTGAGGLMSRVTQLAGLSGLFGGGTGGNEFLPPDQAFRPRADIRDGTLVIGFDIAEDYYLYRDKLAVRLLGPQGASLGALQLPEGKHKQDEYFGDMQVYYLAVSGRAPLSGVAAGDSVSVEVDYQGCADAGLCYPPMTKVLDVQVPAGAGAGAGGGVSAFVPVVPAAPIDGSAPLPRGSAPVSPAAAPLAEQDRIAASLASGSGWLIGATFFGFGLLLAFTPCVFPMVPILSSLIVGHGKSLSPAHGLALSGTYVLGMAATYTAAGVLAGLFGASANLQTAFQNPWVLGSFAALFVALAMSMFGFYELQLPPSWQTRLARLSSRQRGGTYLGAGVMGVLSALIVGPCVAAPLAGALIYIGRTGDALVGGMALFAMAMGMGAPLLVIGASAGRLLPRAGAWMAVVKAVFGVLLLAVAIYLVERILPPWVTLLAWAALFIVTAIYMGALDHLQPGSSGWRRLWKGSGLVMLVYGVLLMVGAAGGGSDPLQPLRGVGLASTGDRAPATLEFRRVKGLDGLQLALVQAGAEGRHVMLDFYADWCVSCKELERYTFSDAAVRSQLADTVLLQTDVTANDAADQAMLESFGLFGPPAILFFGPDGRERREYRLVGFVDAERFRIHVAAAQGTPLAGDDRRSRSRLAASQIGSLR